MQALQTGTIIKTVGLKGELKLKSTTFFAEDRYQEGNVVYLSKDGKSFEKSEVVSYRTYQGFDFVKLKEIPSIEVAEKYISQVETQYCNFYNSVKSFLIPPANSVFLNPIIHSRIPWRLALRMP